MNFTIISDGACDLLKEYTKKNKITVVPFYVTFDGENYTKEGDGIDHDTFYKKMIDEKAVPKSSLPSVGDYYDVFEPFAKENTPIICVCITLKFSGSFNSASVAAKQIISKYPNQKIKVIDSTLNTMSEALLVNELVRMRDNNLSFEDAVNNAEKIKTTGRIYFTIASMEYLIKNGRVGKLALLAGDKLGIKPIIVMKDGDITLGGISRGRKKSIKSTIDSFKKYIKTINVNDYNFLTGAGYDLEELKDFEAAVESECTIKSDSTIKSRIGTTIGCHTGPFPLGIALIKKYDS